MDAEAVDRPDASTGQPAADTRGGTVVLALAVLALVLAGGWWWRATAPVARLVGPSTTPVRPGPADAFTVDPAAGTARRTGPRPGQVTVNVPDGADGRLLSRPDTVRTERSRLTSGQGVLRQARAADGERHLLQFRCTGPGELLVVVDGCPGGRQVHRGLQRLDHVDRGDRRGRAPFQISLSTVGE